MMRDRFDRLSRWDRACSQHWTLSRERRGWRWYVAAAGAHLGDGALWLAVGLATWFLGEARLREVTRWAALSVGVTAVVATAFKVLVRRSRPQEQVGFYARRTDRYSFPSGHAARMAAIAVAVGRFEPAAGLISFLLALLVGLCRVAVGVHYASDVLAGLLIGTLSACGVVSLL
jgi:undecaprenyl-diphosphatase